MAGLMSAFKEEIDTGARRRGLTRARLTALRPAVEGRLRAVATRMSWPMGDSHPVR